MDNAPRGWKDWPFRRTRDSVAVMKNRITVLIILALISGVIVGLLLHRFVADAKWLDGITSGFSLITDIFLRMIKMIIAPLVLSTLIGGIARMGDGASIGRVGLKSMLWFMTASLVSLSIGFTMMAALHPGTGLHLLAAKQAKIDVGTANLTLQGFFEHVFPTSLMDAMARNEVLQIVVFSIFTGLACISLEPHAKARMLELFDILAAVMFKIVGYVMWFAPIAVFAAIASVVAREGFGVLDTYAAFIGTFYLALALLWIVMVGSTTAVIGRRIVPLMKVVREPGLIAFSTASGEAAFPILLANLEGFGVPNRIASFVLPLAYSFNLIGSMLYCTMATLFISEAYDMPLSPSQKAVMALLLFVASKGIALVPRASLLVVSATLPYLHLPDAGFVLLLAVDHILDMGRTGTNTVANGLAATTVARWERQLKSARDAALTAAIAA